MSKNINNSLSASESYNHLRSMKSGVLGTTTKPLRAIMVVAVIGLISNLAWAEKCPDSENFQYGEYDQKHLLDLLECLHVEPEKPCSRICDGTSNEEGNFLYGEENKEKSSISKAHACISEECLVYCRNLYPHNNPKAWPPEIEDLQGMNCPYSMTRYEKLGKGDDIEFEHIVSLAEAHDSGLCKPERGKDREGFGNDPWNLTMAKKSVNRAKSDKDFLEWNLHTDIPRGTKLPKGTKPANQCWFASRVVQVRIKWGLTIDKDERDALKAALQECKDPDDFKLKTSADPCGKPPKP